ncbi:MAG TPA: hypothetical protein VMF06_05405 [Candidatus Limnocylindria bacterium]|jgi:hypothetical protein|nr:hypothetical protein [Candidatus Limnocylindria bacterium]
MSFRESPFIPGHVYRVKVSFQSASYAFVAGELLTFDQEKYSRYDESSVFSFRDSTGLVIKEWWLSDDSPIEVWRQYFEELL